LRNAYVVYVVVVSGFIFQSLISIHMGLEAKVVVEDIHTNICFVLVSPKPGIITALQFVKNETDVDQYSAAMEKLTT